MHCALLPSPVVLLYVPSLHGSGTDDPSSQYEPATHSKHAVLPLSLKNLPATHASHVLCPLDDWYVPGLHAVAY